jgi:hypothetical protein
MMGGRFESPTEEVVSVANRPARLNPKSRHNES